MRERLSGCRQDEETTCEVLWIGWPGGAWDQKEERIEIERTLRESHHSRPVFLSESDVQAFYGGFCNGTLWPLFHYFHVYAEFHPEQWEAYVRVNEEFCEAVLEELRPEDTIWIQDYQLMLLPQLVRKRRPDAKIGFFLHIPFPSYETFRMLPKSWGKTLLEGLLGADVVGFHTFDYVQHCLQSVTRLLGYESEAGRIPLPDGRLVSVECFPMGIDLPRWMNTVTGPCGLDEWENLSVLLGGRKTVFSVDRLDYTKGILHRLEAFSLFLHQHPEWLENVTMVMVVVPSRESVAMYEEMKCRIDQEVGAINGRFGRVGWTPILYQYRQLPASALAAAYAASDICLVTPLRDGMNLVAKEYVACSVDEGGVLVLSELAGAAAELSEALLVNPNHRQEVADAIAAALEMPAEDRRRRMRAMRERLRKYDVVRWAEDFLEALERTSQVRRSAQRELLVGPLRTKLLQEWRAAGSRLVLTDYDGTLSRFHKDPMSASPSSRLLTVLERLAGLPKCDVALVSGRPRATLEQWFGHLTIGLAAEHGGFVREPEARSSEWRRMATEATRWKEEVRPLLDRATARLPGSFVEEKQLSLGWHWRAADPDAGRHRARQLLDELNERIAGIPGIEILPGNKVLEVRSSQINKGVAGLYFLGRSQYDLVVALGDDRTDEDLFRVMPASGWTIKVGGGNSGARCVLKDPEEVLSLLEKLASEAGGAGMPGVD